LKTIGIDGPAWLSDTKDRADAVIVVAIWQGVGYPMVILLGRLQNIDPSFDRSGHRGRRDGPGRGSGQWSSRC